MSGVDVVADLKFESLHHAEDVWWQFVSTETGDDEQERMLRLRRSLLASRIEYRSAVPINRLGDNVGRWDEPASEVRARVFLEDASDLMLLATLLFASKHGPPKVSLSWRDSAPETLRVDVERLFGWTSTAPGRSR